MARCNSDHRVCFSFDVATAHFDASGRDILVDLIDANTSTVLEPLTEHLAADTTNVQDCFRLDATGRTTTIKIGVPAGSDLDLSGTVTAGTESSRCVTSTTTTTTTSSTTTTTQPDHFQCYEIKPGALPPTTVTAQDQFGTQSLTLRFPHRLCAPADKNGGGIINQVQHLVGYELLNSPFTKQAGLSIANQFGTIKVDLTRRDLLLVPTAKSLT